MKQLSIFSVGMAIVSSVALVAATVEMERMKTIDAALRDRGVTGLLAVARNDPAPRIPSKWYVETRMRDADEIKAAIAARDFGFALAGRLEEVARRFQELPPNEVLCSETHQLLDLMEWCVVADGIGNLLLAERCQDIAAIGLGRVTANLGFSLDECKKLASRVSFASNLANVVKRSRVLDAEAGVNLFAGCKNSEDMARVWRAGLRLRYPQWKDFALQMKEEGQNVPDEIFREDDIRPKSTLQAAGDFFEIPTGWNNEISFTCRTRWDMRNHDYFLVDTGSQLAQKALGLLRFREEVGYFPEKHQRTLEELKEHDEAVAKYAKMGIKVTKAEDNPNYDPLEEAFRLAWLNRPNIDKKNTDDYNFYEWAFQAYTEIALGKFYDRDAANIRQLEERKKFQLEMEQKVKTP